MRVWTPILIVLVAAACAGAPPAPRAAVVPPLAVDAPTVQPEQRSYASADRSPPLPAVEEPAAEIGGEPVYRTVVHTVEVPVSGSAGGGERYEEDPGYYEYAGQRRTARPRRTTRFPVNTAIGAGIGAIIGNQSGRRDKGALIGGGVGLLFDLARWTR